MKKLFFLLLIPVMAAGQKQDTVWLGHGLYAIIGPSGKVDTAWQVDTSKAWLFDLRSGTTAHFAIDTPTVRYDTASIVMLVCDTSKRDMIENVSGVIYKPKMGFVFWQSGYRVFELYSKYYTMGNVYYLDENKKRLPKNIIVWQVQ